MKGHLKLVEKRVQEFDSEMDAPIQRPEGPITVITMAIVWSAAIIFCLLVWKVLILLAVKMAIH